MAYGARHSRYCQGEFLTQERFDSCRTSRPIAPEVNSVLDMFGVFQIPSQQVFGMLFGASDLPILPAEWLNFHLFWGMEIHTKYEQAERCRHLFVRNEFSRQISRSVVWEGKRCLGSNLPCNCHPADIERSSSTRSCAMNQKMLCPELSHGKIDVWQPCLKWFTIGDCDNTHLNTK